MNIIQNGFVAASSITNAFDASVFTPIAIDMITIVTELIPVGVMVLGITIAARFGFSFVRGLFRMAS